MKNYYYIDGIVYTEKEMVKSLYPRHRFELIGQFKNRTQAENYVLNEMNPCVYFIQSGKRI